MKWHKTLWIGKGLNNKIWNIKWKIKHNAGQLNVYLLTIPQNSNNQLEIIHAAMLLFRYYPKKDLYIVGVAKGYNDALALVCEITNETYQKTGNANIKDYILHASKEDGEICRS